MPESIERKDKRFFENKKINQQYSYTTREAIATFKDKNGNLDWLPSKEGQTIEQWFVDRIYQQRSASNLTKATIMGCFGVHGNSDRELDNKLRDYLYDEFDDFLEVNFENDGQGTEWMLTRVTGIYEEMGFHPNCVDDIIDNKEFMNRWFDKIKSSKYTYFNDDDIVSKVYKLRPWQDTIVTEMLGSGKTHHQLGLAPRFGKTLAVLDYTKVKVLNGVYDKDTLYVVPASKSLSSNSSFVKDFEDFGFSKYFNIVNNTSLFKDEDKIIEGLRNELPDGAQLILVTDEGDFASHTEISTDKIELIKDNFNIVEQIVMTGTGIGKAAKIFNEVPTKKINFSYVTYDDMLEMGGDVVKRHIVNVEYSINEFDDSVKNIRQSIEDPLNHKQVSKYLYNWTLDEITEQRANLQPSEIVMVFVKPDRNDSLHQLMETYQKMYVDEAHCIALTGNSPTGRVSNRTAEKVVKRTYHDMRKVDDMRKLIVFSAGIGNRSFSVSTINRVIEMSDSEISSANIQEFARCYTWEDGKEIADVVRIGFSPMALAEEIYLIENDMPDYSIKSKVRAGKFLNNNSFTDVIMDENGQFLEYKIRESANGEDIGTFLDDVCKFTDRTSYIATRLWGEGLVVDVEAGKSKKAKTNSLSTSSSNGKKIKTKKDKSGNEKPTASDEKRLKQYVNVVRCIPSLAQIEGIYNIEDFVESSYWNDFLEIDKQIFKENYENSSEFKEIVNSLFRLSESRSFDEHNERLVEYMEIRS